MTDERWESVPGFPLYEVSDHGRVRSWRPIGGPHIRPRTAPLVLRPGKNRYGYLRVGFWLNGRQSSLLVHTLVLSVFVGQRPDGMQCRHLNGNPLDNRLVNLAWGTAADNGRDIRKHGSNAGERNSNSKLTAQDVRDIRAASASVSVLARRYGVTGTCVRSVLKLKRWRHVA